MALDFTKNSEIGSFFAHFYELIENESLLDRIRQSQDASEVMEVLNACILWSSQMRKLLL